MKEQPQSPGPMFRIDAYRPDEMARLVRDRAPAKAQLDAFTTIGLGIVAGAFVALGAAFMTATMTGADWTDGPMRLLGGLAFSIGFVLLLVGGGQLFTSNSLLIMGWASRVITLGQLLRNWSLVLVGNAIGVLGTVLLIFASGHALFNDGAVGATTLFVANLKFDRSIGQAVVVGVLGNGLVCLAVWLSYSARTTTDRIVAVVPPIVAMVALNVDHAVSNMYFLAMGLLARTQPEVLTAAAEAGIELPAVDLGQALAILAAVAFGNMLGGGILVANVYWLLYLRDPDH